MRAITLAAILVLVAGCSSNSPVSPKLSSSANGIAAAHVYVGGNMADGQVVQGARGQTLLEARMSDAGHLGNIRQVMVRYDLPGMGGGMMRRTGQQLCYDDGTHGDAVAGDGVYHFMDADDMIGCGGANSPMGDYQYHFSCDLSDGTHSGETTVTVRRN